MNQVQTVPRNNEVEFTPFGSEDKVKLNVSIIQKFVAIPTRTGKVPDDRECIRFMMLCRSRRLNPFEGDCFLMGYEGREGINWSLITAHQAFLKRAEVHPEFDGMDSGVIVREGEDGDIKEREGDFLYPEDILLGGWAIVHFKQRKHPMKRRLNIGTFKKNFGRWVEDPAGMIVKCAEADALRSSFPTMLGGWVSDNERAVIDVAPAKSPEFSDNIRVLEKPEEPAKNADKKAGEPSKTAQEPSGGVSTPPATEKTLPPATAEAQPAGESETQPINSTGPSEALQSVLLLASKSGVTEDQIMAYCRRNDVNIAKPDQKKLSELSEAKLKTIGKAWHNLLPSIRGGAQ